MIRERNVKAPWSIPVSSFLFALCDWDCGGLTTAVILTQI